MGDKDSSHTGVRVNVGGNLIGDKTKIAGRDITETTTSDERRRGVPVLTVTAVLMLLALTVGCLLYLRIG